MSAIGTTAVCDEVHSIGGLGRWSVGDGLGALVFDLIGIPMLEATPLIDQGRDMQFSVDLDTEHWPFRGWR